jgi:hypothetical protein
MSDKPAEVAGDVAASVVKATFEKVTGVRVSVEDLIALGVETRLLRERVDAFQAEGTANLTAAREGMSEVCARICEQFAAEVPQNAQCQIYALECAKRIRALNAPKKEPAGG